MQSTTPKDLPSSDVTHASLGVGGTKLDPDIITSLLGVQPHRKFRAGDRYAGRDIDGNHVIYTRALGVWGIDSVRLVSSPDPADHVRAVVEVIHPVRGRWLDILSKGYEGNLWIIHARDEGESGYALDAGLIRQIADIRVNVSVVCNIIS